MWFTENSWQPMLLFAIFAVLAAVAWARRLQSRYLAIAAGCLIAIGATWLIERSIVTHRERIAESIVGITSAFQQKNLDETLSYVSQQSPDLSELITYAIYPVTIEEMRLTDIQIELTGGGSRAISRFRVNAKMQAGSVQARRPTYWESRWQLEAGEWKMLDINQLDPVTGNVLETFYQLRDNANSSQWRDG